MDRIDRSTFLTRSMKAMAATLIAPSMLARAEQQAASPQQPFAMPTPTDPGTLTFTQEPLPYAFDALEPFIDKQTMEIHYTRHHAKYVKEVNDALKEENIQATSATELFANISKYSAKVRNNSGGAWNHTMFWKVMKPKGNAIPGKLNDAITGSFGSVDDFKAKFSEAAMKRFGSGWAWLVSQNGKLTIGSTPNQDNPLMDVSELKGTPLLCLDVWEHAYYLKYQNKRDEYVANWWNVVDWEEVARRLA